MDTVRPNRIIAVFAALVFLSLTGACTLDFEQFAAADVGVDAAPDDADVGPDAIDNNDTPLEPGEFGGFCESTDDCSDDLQCLGEVCLSPCTSDNECPDGAGCYQIGQERFCAPRCSDTNSCAHIEGRDDLSCVYLVQTREFGSSPHSLARACLTDSADDGVFDGIDNCPETANAPQTDSVGDGVGDACSATPHCHADAADGVLDFEATTFRAGQFSVPSSVDGRWLPVAGTVDANGSPESTLLLLDRQSGQWHDKGSLEHPGQDRFFAPTNRGGYYLSPGLRDGEPVGGWTRITATGDITYGPTYSDPSTTYINPRSNAVRFPNGEVRALLLYESPLVGGDLGFYTADLGSSLNFQAIQYAGALAATNGPLNDPSTYDAPQSLHHPDGTTSFAMWNPVASTLVLVDLPAPRTAPSASMAVHQLPIPEVWVDGDNGDNGDNGLGDELETEDLSDFDPIAVTAPGGQIYVFDRNTGRAGRFIAERDEEHAFARSWSSFERIPEYDLDDFGDFDDFQVYLLPFARGFGIIGRPADGSEAGLQVRELYFACHPITDSRDTAGDGVGDFIDNCPLIENADQADLDGDAWGDECDPDIDGDGIPNVDDFIEVEADDDNGGDDSLGEGLEEENGENGDPEPEIIDLSRDSTNDGVDNIDADDTDGDGISDRYDPFPLDSSNDGTFNRWTTDASGNGYSDSFLRGLDLSPYRYFSLPVGQTFAYITEDDAGQRTIYYGALDSPDQAQAIDLPADVNPHQISFGNDEHTIYFLADAPGADNRFFVYDAREGEVILEQDIYPDAVYPDYPNLALRSVSMLDDDRFVIVHESGDGQTWRVSRVTPGEDFSRTQIFSQFRFIWSAHFHNDALIFLGADTDCRECAGAYQYLSATDSFTLLEGSAFGVDAISARDQFVTLAGPASSDSEQRRIQHLRNQGTSSAGSVLVAEELSQLSDVAFSHYRNSIGTPQPTQQPPVMATVSRRGQTSDLWIHLPHLSDPDQRWQLLVASEDSIVEAAWAP